MRIFDGGGAGFRIDGNGCRGGSKQSAALDQLLCADAIGEEAVVADADQARRQHVEQEAADELDRIESHGLGAGMIRVVFPVEADATILQSAKPLVGDGDAVSVASQILEDASWSPEGRLEVNDPFELCGRFTHGLERCGLGQIAKLAREVKPTFAKGSSQIEKEEFAEQSAEDFVRKEEGVLPASDPPAAVGGEAAAGHDAVQVQVAGRRREVGMTEQSLNRTEIDAGFEQVSGEGMSKQMRMNGLSDAG